MRLSLIPIILLSLFAPKKDLYLMRHVPTGLYKIGKSANPTERVKQIDYVVNCETDGDVILIKVYKDQGDMERWLHMMFKRANMKYCRRNTKGKRINSREWFDLSESDLDRLDCVLEN